MWKKSFIVSPRGSSLNELNEKDTFVIKIVCVCETPTVKSLKIIDSGFEIKEVPLNSLPATTWGFTIPSFYLTIALAKYSYSSSESSGL